jgi:serine beta-lactamase-like protein LACTB
MRKRRLRSLLGRPAVVLLLIAVSVQGQPARPLSGTLRQALEKIITAEMARQKIPGLSVAIVTNHRLQWARGFGLADIENSVPATDATVYRWGSISKTITAVAAMQLAERGKLDLDAPIQKYCPAFPEKPWPITTRQLLGHLSGIRHYRNEEEVTSTRHYTTLVEALDIFKNDPLLFEPGTKFSYTTYGYNVIGCVIEGASGMNFMDYVRENIFRPAGMDRARDDDVFEIIPRRAQGYRRTSTGELRNSPLADTSNKIPGGGLCSTVIDLARFAIALQTARLVRRETLDQMWTRQKTRDGQLTSYGLGWSIGDHHGRKEIYHTGGQPRVSTVLYMQPEKGSAIVILSNLERAAVLPLARQISDLLSR